ncbi:MAG TPA: competence/damage-inducible protein A [Chloroflexota bacterium]
MRAGILSIGEELLRGDVVDTNAAFLAREASQLGLRVESISAQGDSLPALSGAVERSLRTVDVTICTGGLGPTADDLTREAIAAALGEEMRIQPDLLADLEGRFASMGRRMPERNTKQATLISSAEAIPNPNGTAPGWYVSRGTRVVAALPGPPREMRPMWQNWVKPRLEAMLDGKVAMLSLLTFGLGESAVEEKLDDIIQGNPRVVVATYAKESAVEVHITARADTLEESRHLLFQTEAHIRQRLGEVIFGSGTETLSSATLDAAAQNGMSIAVMESCTGGALASMITDTAGSSNSFRGGVVAYTREAKERYGVPSEVIERHGIISAETALAMADAARFLFHSDIGLGTTGVAGSDPVEDRPSGTVFIALSGNSLRETREIHRPGDRPFIKRFASLCALDLLRRQLRHGA